MRNHKSKPALLLYMALGLATGLAVSSCGSSGSSGSSTSSTTASSMDQLPETSTLFSADGASSSESVIKSLTKAVSGTPSKLKTFTSSNADTIFWNGLLATITSANSATQPQIDAYWDGMGACRMAQGVGYSFQQIMSAGTSLCYMQKVPSAGSAVVIEQGSVTVAQALTQAEGNQITKASVSGGGQDSQTIFIKVFGTDSSEGGDGYAADLWFCSAAGVVGGYEKIRLNSSTGVLSLTSVHSDGNGSFAGVMSGTITKSGSTYIYSTSADRSGTVYFAPADSSSTFLGSVLLDSAGLLTARSYQNGSFGGGQSQTSKTAIFANLTSDTTDMNTLAFTQAGFAVYFAMGSSSNSFTGVTEWQDTHYASGTSSTLTAQVQAEDFSNAIYTGATTTYAALVSAKSDYSCSTTPDYIVSMDFDKSALAAIQTECENPFSEMQFCDSSAVSSVGQIVMQSQQSLFGACSTSFCNEGDDFACQKWADNNPGNNAGITTANASCNSGCCGTQ